ncbi:hypothetical protein P0W64_01500 [Tsukamurella sp. 8F]|uniref:hypothetical protein n=1 Tax=unclassified Tsukamurella TaxID=2633480 RepID=UPI0023B96C30|nr:MULTISPECIES: hypothetical protein [unclassified Tsukamurella]MDF0531087.1 hypothetical protein [Tsukamurella sp. 8J]MDF0585446.1 hypothetical protein [Tsukamurella sp. 8F]
MRYVELLCWLLPASRVKNLVLRRVFRRSVAPSARIGPTLLLGVREVEIGEGVTVEAGNAFRGLSRLHLGAEAKVGSWNWVSAHPVYQEIDPAAGTLFVDYRAKIGSRCYVDASGTVTLGRYAVLGGNRCTVQTHEPDFEAAVQTVGRIDLEDYAFASTASVLLKGARLPERSLLAAHATLVAPRSDDDRRPGGLYVGTPARYRRPVDGEYFRRTENVMTEHRIDSPQGAIDSLRAVADSPRAVADSPHGVVGSPREGTH